MYTVISGNKVPSFYVVNTNQNNPPNDNPAYYDVLNLQLLNRYIAPYYVPPETEYNLLSASMIDNSGANRGNVIDLSVNPLFGTVLTATLYYISAMNISYTANSDSAVEDDGLLLSSSSYQNHFLFLPVFLPTASENKTVINLSGIKIFQTKYLKYNFELSGILTGFAFVNIYGKIIIP
jgi:hypothetical protein